ncbi:MAG: hypothetical protein K2L10_09155 [Ruminococcus sp.]|nr:hypothetical protein [Ruminococcus sp.]
MIQEKNQQKNLYSVGRERAEKGESQKFWLDLLQNVWCAERDGVYFF